MKNRAIAAISGVKNSGKTTLMEKLIRVLTGRGLQVAAVKHDGHDFTPDVPGTDSWRFGQAGACGYAIYSPWRYQLVRQTQGVCERDFFQAFPEADVILLEGFKDSPYPKIEVVRVAHRPGVRPSHAAGSGHRPAFVAGRDSGAGAGRCGGYCGSDFRAKAVRE